MSIELTDQAQKAYLCWSHYQDMMVSNKFLNKTHKKIICDLEEMWREEFLNVSEYMIPTIMEAAGGTLIDNEIKF
jgi:hypothetical protein